MDPTHFIAGRTITPRASDSEIEDFYDTHSGLAHRALPSILAILHARSRRRNGPRGGPPSFAVSHPAE